MTEQELPEGWDHDRIQRMLSFYENQTDDEAVAELEAAWNDPHSAFVQVPHELLPAVRALLLGMPCPPETLDEWLKLYPGQPKRAQAHFQADSAFTEAVPKAHRLTG
ncbi:MAG: hypothetical protein C0506_05510 [Anaerolinea sp.]|nr:hypothetical protein [Anaerolinea sp.]